MKKKTLLFVFLAWKTQNQASLPFFVKTFKDHTKMKEFSAKHAGKWKPTYPNYSSNYFRETE